MKGALCVFLFGSLLSLLFLGGDASWDSRLILWPKYTSVTRMDLFGDQKVYSYTFPYL